MADSVSDRACRATDAEIEAGVETAVVQRCLAKRPWRPPLVGLDVDLEAVEPASPQRVIDDTTQRVGGSAAVGGADMASHSLGARERHPSAGPSAAPGQDASVPDGDGSGAADVLGTHGAVPPAAEGRRFSPPAVGSRLLMSISIVVAGIVLLAIIGLLDWSLPLVGSDNERGAPTAAGVGGDDRTEAGLSQAQVAALATELVGGGWPSLALTVSPEGLTISGAVANDDERVEVLAIVGRRFDGVAINDRLTISSGRPAHVILELSQNGVRLQGTVPNRALAEELLDRAAAVYLDDQVENGLIVDPTVGTPLAISASGAVDEALFDLIVSGFSGIVGVDPVLTDELVPAEPSALEIGLNGAGPIRFASGSAVILSESASTLDQVATVLASNRQVVVEIGSHVASDGDDDAAYRLSRMRAEVVRTELIARGVSNELIARGFGPSRLSAGAASSTAIGRQTGGVEFRILG